MHDPDVFQLQCLRVDMKLCVEFIQADNAIFGAEREEIRRAGG
jgi:hypothetical protein